MAIVEMHRTGVPASIKLAQAVLESDSGRSGFALSSNNHFGIKCKSYWIGRKYYHKDDDVNSRGVLVESCFRAYNQVMDSYVDHSNFLRNSPNYQDLFRLGNTDFKAWANGLQNSGYATDNTYGDKLIRIIENYQLGRYDLL